MKNLKFHTADKKGKTKCHWLHIGKPQINCSIPKIHDENMEEVSEDTYLGDIVSNDGKNTKNIKSRVSKGIGIIAQINNLMKIISFGNHTIEIGLVLRESMLINGILTNGESWYNVTKTEIKDLEKIDAMYLQKLLESPISTPREAFYLELGIVPIECILKQRRLNYLHYLLTRKKQSLLYKFFMTQLVNPSPGDWTVQIKEDLEDVKIQMSLSEIEKMSKFTFSKLVKSKIRKYTLEKLMKKKEKHSKMKNIVYDELKIQSYFTNAEISTEKAKIIFKYRTRMLKFAENYRGEANNVMCPLCNLHPDSQDMIEQCKIVKEKFTKPEKCKQIYKENVEVEDAKLLTDIIKLRTETIEASIKLADR